MLGQTSCRRPWPSHDPTHVALHYIGAREDLGLQGEAAFQTQSPGPVVGVVTSLAESWASDSAGQ